MARKRIFQPDMTVQRVQDIELRQLAAKGIRGLLLDLDNTLTVWHGMTVEPQVQAWLEQARQSGFRLCILSNSHAARVQPMGQLLQIPAVHMSAKPRTGAFRRGCQELDLPPSQVAMVGDQLLTDICGANRAGLFTIMTELIDGREMWGTAHIARPMERLVRRWMKPGRGE